MQLVKLVLNVVNCLISTNLVNFYQNVPRIRKTNLLFRRTSEIEVLTAHQAVQQIPADVRLVKMTRKSPEWYCTGQYIFGFYDFIVSGGTDSAPIIIQKHILLNWLWWHHHQSSRMCEARQRWAAPLTACSNCFTLKVGRSIKHAAVFALCFHPNVILTSIHLVIRKKLIKDN